MILEHGIQKKGIISFSFSCLGLIPSHQMTSCVPDSGCLYTLSSLLGNSLFHLVPLANSRSSSNVLSINPLSCFQTSLLKVYYCVHIMVLIPLFLFWWPSFPLWDSELHEGFIHIYFLYSSYISTWHVVGPYYYLYSMSDSLVFRFCLFKQ